MNQGFVFAIILVFTMGLTACQLSVHNRPEENPGDDAARTLGVTLLQNGGFESGVSSWVDWGLNPQASTESKKSGNYALKIGTGAGGRAQQVIGASSNTTYSLIAWARVSAAGNNGQVTARVTTSSGSTVEYPLLFSSTGFYEKRISFTTPNNLSKLEVFVYKTAGNGYLYADEIQLYQGRDARYWPFPSSSIWNTPLAQNNEGNYVAANIQQATASGMTVDEDILVLTPYETSTNVYTNYKDWSTQQAGARCAQEGPLLATLPIPSDWTYYHNGGETPNASAAVLKSDGVTLFQTQPLHRCSAGGIATSHYVFTDMNIKTGDGIEGSHGGSRMSSIGGTIRVGELRPGNVIRHALKVNIFGKRNMYCASNEADAKSGYRWPALTADSYACTSGHPLRYGGTNTAVQQGSLLALKTSFNLAGLETEPARIIATAMRDYGAYLVDDTAWDVYALMTERGPNGNVVDEFQSVWGYSMTPSSKNNAWARDMDRIFTNLWVVNNSSASNVGGGSSSASRRAPAAPAFHDATTTNPPPPSPPPSPPPATNIAQNPGFESDFSSWTGSNGTTSVVSSGARSGGKAAQLGSSGSNVQGERYQGVSLQSGATYTVSAYFKSSGSAWCSVGVKGSAASGWFDFHAESGGSSYTQASRTFTAPSSISFANLYVWKTASTGTCTVDDVSLVKQ